MIQKILPFGLIITYCLSYGDALAKGIGMNGLPLFLVAAVPVILFLFSTAFKIRSLYFLADRKKIYAYGFFIVVLMTYAWLKIAA
jgi:hypothetical protein